MAPVALVVLLWALWSVVEKRAVRASSPMMVQLIITYVYSACAPLLFMLMKLRGEALVWTMPGVGWASAAALLVLGANVSYLYALRSGDAGYVAGATGVWPVLTLAISVAFMGESLSPAKVAGTVLIVAGGLCIGG